MKKFENPQIEVFKFALEDVISTSVNTGGSADMGGDTTED